MTRKGEPKDSAGGNKPLGAGHGSFDRIDSASLFKDLRLGKGKTFLDIACGRGDYLIAAAKLVGPEGRLLAIDLWREGIAALVSEARRLGVQNLETRVADAGKKIPFADGAADAALMGVVLHDLVEEKNEAKALRETARVLKPGGLFAVLEFKKIDSETGPPRHVRLEPREVTGLVTPHGFKKDRFKDLGPDLYYLIFRREGAHAGEPPAR